MERNTGLSVVALNRETETVTVNLFGKVRDLKANWYDSPEPRSCRVEVYGLGVRYPTGGKVWFGHFTYWPATGHINNIQTPMEHRSRWATVSVVGFYEDVKDDYRSKRPSR